MMILNAVLLMSFLGLVSGGCLTVACRFFAVEEDPLIEAIKEVLPGANCGACGYPGCGEAARAISRGKAPPNACLAGGTEVTLGIARILNLRLSVGEPVVAVPGCIGGDRSEKRFYYRGIDSCRAEQVVYGGSILCEKGCLGHGTCVDVCYFNAISMGPDRVPRIMADRCRGCGKCVEVCPRGVLSLMGAGDKLLHLNQVDECLAPCRQKCPAQIDVPRMVEYLRQRAYSKALAVIKERNPLPLSTGRVCAHPCENICRRNIPDQGVAVCQLGRFLSELTLDPGFEEPPPCAPDTGCAVAVIGGGPSGLSSAYFLRRLGHHPVIFEKRRKLGGMLRYGIPEYRLPKYLVDRDIQGIVRLGVEVRPRMTLGKDFHLSDLKDQGFSAVFLGMGAWHVPSLSVAGEHCTGVMGSLDFLSRVGDDIQNLAGGNAVVIGESNTAMDCARSCIRLNASSVTVICPAEQKGMSARKRDVVRAMEEGVKVLFLTLPIRIFSDSRYHVTCLEYGRIEPGGEKDRSEGGGKREEIKADLIISAHERIPVLDPFLGGKQNEYAFKASEKSTLEAHKDTLMAACPNVFTAGDMYTGRASVIEAVAGGRRAAGYIHQLLTTGEVRVLPGVQKRINVRSILKDVTVSGHIPKLVVSELEPEVRKASFVEEAMVTITADQAVQEARRCLRCGTLCND